MSCPRRGCRFVSLLAVAVLASGACGTNSVPTAHPGTSGPATGAPPPTTSSGPSASPSASASCAGRVLGSLSLEQRVGQLFLLGLANDRLDSTEAAAIRAVHFGSVWFVQTTTDGAQAARAVADQVQALGSPAATGSIRFFVAANQEGGIIQALRGPGFSTIPSAVEQGLLAPSALRGDSEGWGRELLAAGVNMNFAPVMDVVPPGTDAQNQPIGALKREFGHDPETVAREGAAFLGGMAAAAVATTAKHFPGLGRVVGNTDLTAGVVDDTTTEDDPYLAPFRAAVDGGAPFVMVALATYTQIDPHHLAAFSPVVIRHLLRSGLGFDGVVVSDDLGETKAVAGIAPADRAISFLEAGGDMIISKTLAPAEAMATAVVSKASTDPAFRSLVDAAALKVLQAKERFGLLPCGGE